MKALNIKTENWQRNLHRTGKTEVTPTMGGITQRATKPRSDTRRVRKVTKLTQRVPQRSKIVPGINSVEFQRDSKGDGGKGDDPDIIDAKPEVKQKDWRIVAIFIES